MNEKTHYRKAFKSPYLSSADIAEPINLTISRVVYEQDKTKKTKEFFNTAYFVEKEIRKGEAMKPMVLNVGNTEIVRGFAGGSKYLEDWPKNIPITVYCLENVKFGRDTVSGIRVNPRQPEAQKAELLPNTKEWGRAVAACKRDGNLNSILKHMTINQANQKEIFAQANTQ